MTEQTLIDVNVVRTEHPYIVRIPGICGGRPIIRNSRISVRQVAQLYKAGDLVDEIVQAYPQLAPAAVYDAISYYLDHQAEIEQEIVENRMEQLIAEHRLRVNERGFVTFPNKENTH